jgi:hypothetical protein
VISVAAAPIDSPSPPSPADLREAPRCLRGHELTRANRLPYGLALGWRVYRQCNREKNARRYAAQRAAQGKTVRPLSGRLTCPHGHVWSPEIITTRGKKRRHRECRTCVRLLGLHQRDRINAQQRARYAARRARESA